MSSNMLAASMPAENDSGSDDEWWGVSIAQEEELRRTRAQRLMHNMLMLASYFSLMGTELLAENMPREVWKVDRSRDLHFDMMNYWPQYSLELQNKLYIKHFRVDARTFKHLINEVEVCLCKARLCLWQSAFLLSMYQCSG